MIHRSRITSELMAHQMACMLNDEINESAWARRRRLRRMSSLIVPRNMSWPLVITAVALWTMIILLTCAWFTGAIAEGTVQTATVAVEEGSVLNVRAQPGMDAEVLFSLVRGTHVKVLAVLDEWARIGWAVCEDGQPIGWVSLKYLKEDVYQ